MKLKSAYFIIFTLFGLANSIAKANPDTEAIAWEIAKNIPEFAPSKVISSIEATLDLDNSRGCTGQLISQTGHFLTALHCVYRSILEEGPYIKVYNGEDIKMKGHLVHDFSHFPYETKSVEEVGRYLRINMSEEDPTLVFTGRGFFEIPPLIKTAEQFTIINNEVEKFKMYQEDYAILKYTSKAIKNKNCIITSETPPKSGDQAWAVGFPANFQFGVNIAIRHVARGIIINSFSELKNATGYLDRYPEEAWLDFDRYFLFTGQAVNGMSGGSVFDNQGKLIGHVVAVGSAGFTIVQKISFVKEDLIEKIGINKAQEFFNCQ